MVETLFFVIKSGRSLTQDQDVWMGVCGGRNGREKEISTWQAFIPSISELLLLLTTHYSVVAEQQEKINK